MVMVELVRILGGVEHHDNLHILLHSPEEVQMSLLYIYIESSYGKQSGLFHTRSRDRN
jgi:hypothetical protein